MPLQDGIYQIRFVPKDIKIPFFGGVYATSGKLNGPIRAEAMGPSASGEQKWQIQAVEGKPDTYIIILPGINDGVNIVVQAGFGVAKKRGHAEPVVLTSEFSEWVLILVDEENGVYRIQEPSDGMVGAVWAVNEEDNMLLAKPYPVIRDMPALPHWQFVSIY
ncbi:hypothetical protein BDZ97DRAFT_2063086 [Flammula alnicola]|nr:hypothetical protein BDZ97DRAFT_2063086 [Flammula alnicola]